MQRDHKYFLWRFPPKIRRTAGTNVEVFYMNDGEDEFGPCGDNGILVPMCAAFVEREWPDAYAVLRPMQYVEVFLPPGHMVGPVVKPIEVPK